MRLIATITCLAALTACGGGNDAGTEPAPTAAQTTTGAATTPPAAEETPPVAISGKVNDRGTEDLGSETSFEMDLGDFYFDPTYVKAQPGAMITVRLTNTGQAPHSFTIDRPKVDVTVSAGGTGAASFAMPKSGTLVFYCTFHKAQGMQGGFYSG